MGSLSNSLGAYMTLYPNIYVDLFIYMSRLHEIEGDKYIDCEQIK